MYWKVLLDVVIIITLLSAPQLLYMLQFRKFIILSNAHAFVIPQSLHHCLNYIISVFSVVVYECVNSVLAATLLCPANYVTYHCSVIQRSYASDCQFYLVSSTTIYHL